MIQLRSVCLGLASAALATACSSNNAASSSADAAPPLPLPPDATFPATARIPLVAAVGGGGLYTAMVDIGAQTFALWVDTDGGTTAVAGGTCPSCMVSPLYTPGATAVDQQVTNTAVGGAASWTGEIYADQFTVGGLPPIDLKFGMMTSQGNFLDDINNSYQGVIGFGPRAPTGGTGSYFAAAVTAGVSPKMTFELCAATSSGTLWLGEPDATTTAAMAAPLKYTPMIPMVAGGNDQYEVGLDDLAIGGTSLGFGSGTFLGVLVDPSLDESVLPPVVVDALITAVDASPAIAALFGTQTLDLQTVAGHCLIATGVTAAQVDAMLPAMTLSFPDGSGGTFPISIPPTQSYLIDHGSGRFCLNVTSYATATAIGASLMHALVTELDIVHQQIGFANDIGCTH